MLCETFLLNKVLIRKNLLKFDDVLNDQRHVIFSQRNGVMNSEKVFDLLGNTPEGIAKVMNATTKDPTSKHLEKIYQRIREYDKINYNTSMHYINMQNKFKKDDK